MKVGNKNFLKKFKIFLLTILFLINIIYFTFNTQIESVKAAGIPVTDIPLLGSFARWSGFDTTDKIKNKILDELKAAFFTNVIGGLTTKIAEQAAIYLVAGGEGESKQWFDDLGNVVEGAFENAALGAAENIIKGITGIDICTFDPRIKLDLTLKILPTFGGKHAFQPPKPSCDWKQLQSHWEEIGKSKFIEFNYRFAEGGTVDTNVNRLSSNLSVDDTLRRYDERFLQLQLLAVGNCSAPQGGKVRCSDPPVMISLKNIAELLAGDGFRKQLENDIKEIMANAGTKNKATLSVGTYLINPANIPIIKGEWLKRIEPQISTLNSIKGLYPGCKNTSALTLYGNPGSCAQVMSGLGYSRVPAPPAQGTPQTTIAAFENEWRDKISHVETITNTLLSVYQEFKIQIEQNLQPDMFEGGLGYNLRWAMDIFNPSANELDAYNQIVKEIQNKSFSDFINKRLQAQVNQGWKDVTNRITGAVMMPANMIRSFGEEKISRSKHPKTWTYTRSIAAEATGVFLQTLYDQLVIKYLKPLVEGQTTVKESTKNLSKLTAVTEKGALDISKDIASPFSRALKTAEGIESYIEKLTEPYTISYSTPEINLLADFQLKLEGDVKPNLYNNVIDQNFSLALANKMTIKEAIAKGYLVSDYIFSWGQENSYNLANIKKLRKARVVPLGLELAVELIRDCNYRKSLDINGDGQPDYANFSDLADYPFGYNKATELYRSQRLQNCLFKPLLNIEDFAAVQSYNIAKMNEVVNATLKDVVEGFDKAGSGICGDLDDQESPFCNLVDPNWLLKVPISKCSLSTDQEPYGENLVTNTTGQRYSRCPDFLSCIHEDGRGGCEKEKYGFCVKEKNVWQFGSNSCPESFDSCRTYRMAGQSTNETVSYLKKTLSGSNICGPENAGCGWYSIKALAGLWQDFASFTNQNDCQRAGGTWLAEENTCQAERIYLNHYAESCPAQSDGCTLFYNYRDYANNLIGDSSFEYTPEGNFPESWDLVFKFELPGTNILNGNNINNESECRALFNARGYYETCFNYPYTDQISCLTNGGKWNGFCSDGISSSQNECVANDGIWDYHCEGAVNAITESECLANNGQYKKYCLISLLQYNLCENVQFASKSECESAEHRGTWISSCEMVPQPATPYLTKTDCEANGGHWREYCQNGVLYNTTKKNCNNLLGDWRGYGPYGREFAFVSKDGTDVFHGLSKLVINLGNLNSNEELQIIYKAKFPEPNKVLTRAGDIYTATAYLKSNIPMNKPAILSLKGGIDEINSREFYLNENYTQTYSTLITGTAGNELDIKISLPGGQPNLIVYLDGVSLVLNTIDQVRNFNFVTTYTDYEDNLQLFYKQPPKTLKCHGYGPSDPAPIERAYFTKDSCESHGFFWDAPTASGPPVYNPAATRGICYRYGPDPKECGNYLKPCEAEEVGCQLYTPLTNDPAIPGVVGLTDYCPVECVGYETYKQEPVLYEPYPDPLFHYFIPETASSCNLADVGCTQFTNLDEVAKGGEGIEYYTYLRQCITAGQGLGEKTYFSWQASAGGPPQIIEYLLQADPNTGAPKTFDNSGDCRLTLGENDLNCIRFVDSTGAEYFRDLRKTITVAPAQAPPELSCHPYRKTPTMKDLGKEKENCFNTNGTWQEEAQACIYNVMPSEGITCKAESNGCRAFIGNQGNNIFVNLNDTFEGTGPLGWYLNPEATDLGTTGDLQRVSESISLAGHSLQVRQGINAIYKPVNIQREGYYTLSFWAKTNITSPEIISVKFSTAPTSAEEFASLESGKVILSDTWKNFNLGPIYVNWDNIDNNTLIFANLDSQIYFDNILLKSINDTVYVIKESWNTPASCDRDFYGATVKGAMLGCQAYNDDLGQTHYLKSFSNLCRTSAIGCQILIDTQNSVNPNSQIFNGDNFSLLDDYKVPKDEIKTFVLNNAFSCSNADKGCQKLGKAHYNELKLQFDDVFIKNNPDKYINVPQAIMCSEETLGCTELVNELGSSEFYRIDPLKLCYFAQKTINGIAIEGWFKKGKENEGCSALTIIQADCTDQNFGWSEKYSQCTFVLQDIKDEAACLKEKGEWLSNLPNPKCLSNPFSIYGTNEANKYRGYVAECEEQYNGCTEFRDINPNFIFNGSFENYNLSTGELTNWNAVNQVAGSYEIETNNVMEGGKALRLNERRPTGSTLPSFKISQTVYGLEIGKTYKISFFFRTPSDAVGIGTNCILPKSTLEIVPIGYQDQAKLYHFSSLGLEQQNDWQKAEAKYTVLNGVCLGVKGFLTRERCESTGGIWQEFGSCSKANYTSREGCEQAGNIWTAGRLQNFVLNLWGPNNGCTDAYILYDLIELKEDSEESYYLIDASANLDRSTCTSINWDNGCVQFYNTSNKTFELLKVDKDRDCAEWAVCTSYCSNPKYNNKNSCESLGYLWDESYCTDTDICTKEESGQCVEFAAKKDNVRYDLESQPLIIKRKDIIKQEGYIYRFGAGFLTSLAKWRAGDYSGYSLPGRLPIEYELKLAPDKQFKTYIYENDLGEHDELRFIAPVCKIFPAEDAPLPYQLSLDPNYKDLLNLYSQNFTDLKVLGNLCFYERAKALSYNTYFPPETVGTGVSNICTSPEEAQGKICTSSDGSDCKIGQTTGVCSPIEVVKEFIGQEGMCLEYDTLSPIYGNIYKDFYNSSAKKYNYQPYACLTYYPFLIDLCPFHKDAWSCNANPDCSWNNNICSKK